MKITFFGAGYVGLVSGVCLAEVGNTVTCFDIDKEKINKLNEGVSPIYEPGLSELITKNLTQKSVFFTSDIKRAITSSGIYFIAVGTPSASDGSVDMSYVESCARSIAKEATTDFTVVIKSTVPAGTSQRIKELIQKVLDKRGLSINFKMVSNPEFLREGTSVEDFMNPDRIVIGVEDKTAEDEMSEVYKFFVGKTELIFSDLPTAEIAKYAANAMLATRISFINEVSRICDRVGGDIEDIKRILGTDKRIGAAFLNAGIGYGGSCFPKDVKEIIHFAKAAEIEPYLLESIHKTNEAQKEFFLEKVISLAKAENMNKIGLLGLAFKAGTDDVRESTAIFLAKKLSENGYSITAFDPQGTAGAKKELGNLIGYADSEAVLIEGSKLVIVATEWPEFKGALLGHAKSGQIIFDGRNILTLKEAKELGIDYYSVGRREIKNEKVAEKV